MINLKRTKAILALTVSGLIFSTVAFAKGEEVEAPIEQPKAIEITYNNYKPIEEVVMMSTLTETKVYSYLEITAHILNIRKTPDTNHDPVGTYKKEDLVIAHAKLSNGWYKLSSGNYVNGKYVKVRDDIKTYDEFLEVREELKKKRQQQAAALAAKKKQQTVAVSATATVSKPATTSQGSGKYSSIKISDSERDYLARLIKCEAGGESFDGQVAVAKVVFNRVLDKRFPNTIMDVINANKQFTPVITGKINQVTASKTQYEAIEAALKATDNLGGALYFYAPSIAKSTWFESLKTVAVIGVHHFKVN